MATNVIAMTGSADGGDPAVSDAEPAPSANATVVAVSIVVAAFDLARWGLLSRAITSARTQGDDVEVILAVDNNRELFEKAGIEWPDVRVVLNEGARGASATRNTGAKVATGQFLAFLDDDAEAYPGWSENLVRPLQDDPTIVGVGGEVTAAWPDAKQPRWFPMEFGWVVGATYIGLPTEPAPVRNVWSENMAVRMADFAAVGGFRDGFGKVGNSSRPEDTEFCIRIQSRHPGSRWWFQPGARISHHVPDARASFAFFIKRCYSEGRGKAALSSLVGSKDGMSSERSYMMGAVPRGVLRGLRDVLRLDPSGLLRAGAITSGVASAGFGYLHELVVMRRSRRATTGS